MNANQAHHGPKPQLTLATILAALERMQDQCHALQYPDDCYSTMPLFDSLAHGPVASAIAIKAGIEGLERLLCALVYQLHAHATACGHPLPLSPTVWDRTAARHAAQAQAQAQAEPAHPLG
jgi:hypothetical protein